jgi:hypothetical protein
MKCPLTVMPEGQKCEIRESVSVLAKCEEVQQTCSTCGSGHGFKRDITAAPAAAEAELDDTDLEE